MTTIYEQNAELKRLLELVHRNSAKVKQLVTEAKPGTLSPDLIRKIDFMQLHFRTIKELSLGKEDWR